VQANDITVSTQVINEVCVNLVKKASFAEADVLYSEDMQDGFEIENVRIVNPFSVDQSHEE
jgi:predicted nucleic acid-binding protein